MAAYPMDMSLHASGEDRRQGKRIALRCTAQMFRNSGRMLPTVTENLSNCGFYCRVPERLTPGEEFDCFIRLPSAQAAAPGAALVLACRCRVARVESLSGDSYGIGCHIDDYLIIPE